MQRRARQIGLTLALVFRIALLFTLTYLAALTTPLIVVLDNSISWRDLISNALGENGSA